MAFSSSRSALSFHALITTPEEDDSVSRFNNQSGKGATSTDGSSHSYARPETCMVGGAITHPPCARTSILSPSLLALVPTNTFSGVVKYKCAPPPPVRHVNVTGTPYTPHKATKWSYPTAPSRSTTTRREGPHKIALPVSSGAH